MLQIKVDNAVVDLNGYSITNTAENGYGLKLHLIPICGRRAG